MVSENYKCKYLHVLEQINEKNAKNFTQDELAEFLRVSKRTISSLQNGKIFNFELLYHYAELIGVRLLFEVFE